jgi:hypothetical protein
MITQHQGLLLGIILLVTMSVLCQLTSSISMSIKDKFFDLEKEMAIFKPYDQKLSKLVEMNDIKHVNIDNCRQQPCNLVREPHAKIPCSILRKCGLVNEADLPDKLTDDDIKVLLLSTYHDTGREIIDRKM